jgi:hypothetical protein
MEIICYRCGIPDDEYLKLSEGWLSRYKARVGLKEIKRHGEAASVTIKIAEKERLCIQDLIRKKGYVKHNVFNADDTSLFYT